ncbi:MAG: 50S ribosomal protein L18e [Candidatus Diapherotrites archaeon]|nr:50S ribosomal protein L18e [Candidatus Diapherotrites archaeon]
MNKKSKTIELINELKKKAISDKQMIWRRIAECIEKPTRTMAVVNLYDLDRLGKKNNDKIFVVPGKVLGNGDIALPIKVIALDVSKSAEQKILEKGGNVQYLAEIIDKKIEGSKLIIVK